MGTKTKGEDRSFISLWLSRLERGAESVLRFNGVGSAPAPRGEPRGCLATRGRTPDTKGSLRLQQSECLPSQLPCSPLAEHTWWPALPVGRVHSGH